MAKKILKKVLKNHKKESVSKKEEKKETIKEVKDAKGKVKQDKKYSLTVGLKELFEAGCHLGHKVSKTHPKARKNIYIAKDGMEIVDLAKTLEGLQKACDLIYNAKRNGKKILMVGTKRQAREVVRRIAVECSIPYVTERWLGGTITNWDQIRKNIKKLNKLKEDMEKGKFAELTKKELSLTNKEIVRLDRIVGGLTNLDKLFDILFVVDAGFEKTAIREAKMRRIKVVAITDTDTNPDKVDIVIPANEDGVKSISILVEEIGKAIKSA
jgi:small subunit ribosomal protein S2